MGARRDRTAGAGRRQVLVPFGPAKARGIRRQSRAAFRHDDVTIAYREAGGPRAEYIHYAVRAGADSADS